MRRYSIERRDTDYEEEMIYLEQEFWEGCVQKKLPPPYTESGDLIIASSRRHSSAANMDAPVRPMGTGMTATLMRYLELQEEKKNSEKHSKKLESEMQRLKGILIAEMGSSCTALCEKEGVSYVRCYPQAYAAAVTRLKELMVYPRALIVDVGGFTADYLLMRNGAADLSVCSSLENGVILLYNRICTKVNSEFNRLLQETDIDAILKGQGATYPPRVVLLVEQMAQDFVNDLLNRLRAQMLDLSPGVVVFVGGGAILLRRQIEASAKIGKAIFVEDINANARGYELLYQSETMSR